HVLPVDDVGLLGHDDVIRDPHRVQAALLGAARDLEQPSDFDRTAVVWQADTELHVSPPSETLMAVAGRLYSFAPHGNSRPSQERDGYDESARRAPRVAPKFSADVRGRLGRAARLPRCAIGARRRHAQAGRHPAGRLLHRGGYDGPAPLRQQDRPAVYPNIYE